MMAAYLPEGTTTMGSDLLRSLMDTTHQKLRITVQSQDLPTQELKGVLDQVKATTAEIFPSDRYTVSVTGAAVLLLETTKYLVNNLLQSLVFAIAVTSILMALLFKTPRMVVISLIPNLVPLIMTAGIMGYFNIPLKPSTLLVFSIAFGISVDDTLHYLARYRQELKNSGGRIAEAALTAIRETGVSMFYTSVVLFTGFAVFLASDFGGTQALGLGARKLKRNAPSCPVELLFGAEQARLRQNARQKPAARAVGAPEANMACLKARCLGPHPRLEARGCRAVRA